MQGVISTSTVAPTSTPLGWRSIEAAEYIQDSIRVVKNLEVSVGLRLEHSDGMHESHGRAANYLFDANGAIQTNPTVSDSVFTVNHANLLPEPRAGVAWNPFGHGKTVIHSGFGIYHAQIGRP